MMRRFVLGLLLWSATLAAEASAATRIIVLAPDASSSGPMLLKHIAASVSVLSKTDRLLIYAARPFSQIAEIAPLSDPMMNKSQRDAALVAQFKPVHAFLTAPPAPAHPEPPGNLSIPFVIEELSRNILPALPEKGASILLIGSWLFWDRRDQRTAMTDRYVPSDALLRAPRSEWPYSVVGAQDRLAASTLHFLWPNGQAELESAPHEERVKRWWSIWTSAQGGKVGTMTFDPALAFKRFNSGESSGQPTYQPARDGKPEMIRVSALMPAVMPASFDTPSIAFLRDDAPISKTPPVTSKGIAWVGIKWSIACDFDLYARGDASSSWLFFGNARTEEGRFNKDWVSATGEGQYEFVEFVRDVDLMRTEIAVNLYSCDSATPPEATVRVWFSARIFEATVRLTAKTGNRGAMPMTGAQWARVNLLKVVGLSKE